MTMRTKGDLCGITVRDEDTYGKISTTNTSRYAGTLITLKITDDRETDTIAQCGSMVRAGLFEVSRSASFKATFNQVRGTSWEDWMIKALGSGSGVTSDIPSFDAAFRIAAGEFHLLTGCKVNTFTLTSGSIGGKLELSVDAVGRWHTMTPFTDSDGSSLTFSSVSVPAGIPVTHNADWEWSKDGVTFTPIRAKGFTLTIGRSLQSDPGFSSSADDAIRLEAGEDSVPQDISITLDLTVTSTGPEWDRLRLAFTDGVTLRTVIDGKTVTLKGCVLDIEGPDRSQGTYDETISFDAADATVV